MINKEKREYVIYALFNYLFIYILLYKKGGICMNTRTDSHDGMIDAMIAFAKIRKNNMNDSKRSTNDNLKILNEPDFYKIDNEMLYKWKEFTV